ncbi:MAG: hypothetical protein J1E98_06680 [Lachnospiraceae bacterium]|nr:hypothetical protein [Lachnospiraceae bacterium]
MLNTNDKQKINSYIDNLVRKTKADIKKSLNTGLTRQQAIDKVINITVNKFTPESKMLLSSVYNMMMEHTLNEPLFLDAKNKAAFYEMNLLKELNEKFNFDIPKNINYEQSSLEIKKLINAGVVVVGVGGAISFMFESWIPIGIGVAGLIAGIMATLLDEDKNIGKGSIDALVDSYLDSVKKSILLWIDSVEKYYYERVSDLKGKLVN